MVHIGGVEGVDLVFKSEMNSAVYHDETNNNTTCNG